MVRGYATALARGREEGEAILAGVAHDTNTTQQPGSSGGRTMKQSFSDHKWFSMGWGKIGLRTGGGGGRSFGPLSWTLCDI